MQNQDRRNFVSSIQRSKDYMVTANVQLQPHPPHQKLCHVPEDMSYGATNDIPVQNPMPVQQPTDAMP